MKRLLLVPSALLLVALFGCQDTTGPGEPIASIDDGPSFLFGFIPEISLVKLTDGQDAPTAPGPTLQPGDPVVWTYIVTNTGDVLIDSVRVWDDMQGDVCELHDLDLGTGQSVECQLGGTAVEGQYENLGVATGYGGFSQAQASYSSHYFGEASRAAAMLIDIKPGSSSNCLNPSSKGRLPVAILGSASFDALSVDPSTILAGGVVPPVKWGRGEDVNQDGFLDLVVHFKTPELQAAGLFDFDEDDNPVEITITGDLESPGGGSFTGSDWVNVAGGPYCS